MKKNIEATVFPASRTRHDPGGKVLLRLPGGAVGGAEFSSCGKYRMKLSRDWTPDGASPRSILFIGMNPSTAHESLDDPTCFKEQKYARRWGYTRYLKGNMLDYRSTSPKELPVDPAVARSAENLNALLEMALESEQVVLAYGKLHRRYHPLIGEALDMLESSGRSLFCLRQNKDGSACHPLYLRDSLDLIPFDRTLTA